MIDNLKLKTLLISKGMKQWEFAKKIGINESTLSKIITGRLQPSPSLMQNICKTLKVSNDDLAR